MTIWNHNSFPVFSAVHVAQCMGYSYVEYIMVIIFAAGKQVTNAITSYIDGSAVYGSSDAELAALRTTGGNSYLFCIT